MKHSLLLSLLAFFAGALHAAEDKLVAAVRAVDDARIAATNSGDRAALAAIYSEGLHYAHSNAKVDTKATQLTGVIEGPNRYDLSYKERNFVPVAPGVMMMKGRMTMNLTNKASGQKTTTELSYLAVYREENGKWRFFAWQSCKVP